MMFVLSCDGEPHRVEVDGGSLRLLDHPDADECGVCPAAGAAWDRAAWCDELPEPLAEAAKTRWAAVGVSGRSSLGQVRDTLGDRTPEELEVMVAALGEPSQVPWRDLQRWAGVMRRKLTGADIDALAAVRGLVRPGEAAEWQAACGHLPASEELARFAELGVETGSDAWKWARALGGATIDPVTVEHLRTMGFRHGEDLYGWGQLLGIPSGRVPGPDELDRIRSLRGVGIRRPRHAALWVERLGRVPTAADVQAAPLPRLRVRARLVAEIATAGGPLIPFEGPEFIVLLLCVEMLVVGLAMLVLEAFTHQSQLRVFLETAVVTLVVMAYTQVPTPDLGHGYGRIPWQSPPGSDAHVANGH